MVYFGKIKDSNDEWGFDVFNRNFETCIEVDDDYHMSLINKANAEQKQIKGDKNGNPILVDYPPPTEEEVADMRIQELQGYLLQTDWYALRFADAGEPIPIEVKNKRQDARDEISKLRKFICG